MDADEPFPTSTVEAETWWYARQCARSILKPGSIQDSVQGVY